MNLYKNIKQNKKKMVQVKLLGVAFVWQIFWIVALPLFELRDKIISWGLVGPNCGSCSEQTLASAIIITIPLFLGALVFSIALCNLLWRKGGALSDFFKVVMIVILTTLGTSINFVVAGILNLALN